jgi:hypothetical protein
MDMAEITKMEIIGVKEATFDCSICNTQSLIKYEVQINDIKDSNQHLCLICHNKIAEKLYSATKKRRYKY